MRKFCLAVLLLIIISNLLKAQEVLTGLHTNPMLTSFVQNTRLKMVSATNTLNLPFWDDFSYNNVYPDENLWVDKSVFVNNAYAKGPPTIGVATFDAVDGNGFHYSNASSKPFLADKLISKSIDLSIADKNSTWLSFYYQPEGEGNAPEFNDSLILEFRDTLSNWNKVWFSNGMELDYFIDNVLLMTPELEDEDTTKFKLVMVKVDSAKYFGGAFQFQFKNYASLAGDYNASAAVNCDHWNVDYVFLDQGRDENDTVFRDVAFVQPPNSILRTYESVPWSHYNEVKIGNIAKEYFYMRNNFSKELHLDDIDFRLKDIEANEAIDSFYVNAFGIVAFDNKRAEWKFTNDPFFELEQEELHLEIQLRFVATDDYTRNNTVSKDFHFTNYYAYDDGTVENAYGIEANDAKLAYRFTSHIADTLKGVDMYFLETSPNGEGATSFNLCVWADNGGVPGELLYENVEVPIFSERTNKFVNYKLIKPIAVDGPFFIGWIQKSDKRINVGFDQNTNSADNIFYNIYGIWNKSSVEGSLMMRPILGYHSETGIKLEAKSTSELMVYPNPANNLIYLSDIDNNENNIVTIYNSMGAIVHHSEARTEGIDVSLLTNGLYIVSLNNTRNKRKVARLIISR